MDAMTLSLDDLRQRLQLHSPSVVNELYGVAQRQMQSETGRQGRLDAKASSLLTAAGLSLTVVSSVGLQLVAPRILALHAKHSSWWVPLALLLGVTVLSGLAAAVLAVIAQQVRGDYGGVNEDAVFNADVLRSSDTDGDEGPTLYKRYLTAHLWQVFQRQWGIHEQKAKIIKTGQLAFVLFLGGVLVSLASLAISGLA